MHNIKCQECKRWGLHQMWRGTDKKISPLFTLKPVSVNLAPVWPTLCLIWDVREQQTILTVGLVISNIKISVKQMYKTKDVVESQALFEKHVVQVRTGEAESDNTCLHVKWRGGNSDSVPLHRHTVFLLSQVHHQLLLRHCGAPPLSHLFLP